MIRTLFISTLILFCGCLSIILPACDTEEISLNLNSSDILAYKIDLSKKDASLTDNETSSDIKLTIGNRLKAYGIDKPVVQTLTNDQGSFVIIKTTGIQDIGEVKSLIEQYGRLDFREQVYDTDGRPELDNEGNPIWQIAKATGKDGTEQELTGKYLKPNAKVISNFQDGKPAIAFEFNEEGALMFEQITGRNLVRLLGIAIDGNIISAPTVMAVIKDKGVITGASLKEAKLLAICLNSGPLSAPLSLFKESVVSTPVQTPGIDLNSDKILVYKIDMDKKDPALTDDAVALNLTQRIKDRLWANGIINPIVQSVSNSEGSFIVIQKDGINNIDEAKILIERSRKLDFRETQTDKFGKPELDSQGNPIWQIAKATGMDRAVKELTGKYLKSNAQIVTSYQDGTPEIAFEFNEEGALMFEQITGRNIGKQLAIAIDDEIISTPTVNAVIQSKGIITGASAEEARLIVISLNSGPLDAPLIPYQKTR